MAEINGSVTPPNVVVFGPIPPPLRNLPEDAYSYVIERTDDENLIGHFTIVKDGTLERENKSGPFAAGNIEQGEGKVKVKLENDGQYCKVKLKPKGGFDLNQIYD